MNSKNKLIILALVLMSTALNIWASDCETAIFENFPEAAACKSIKDSEKKKECAFNAVQKKVINCLSNDAIEVRNKCIIRELKTISKSVPNDCITKYKKQFDDTIIAKEKEKFGTSTLEKNIKASEALEEKKLKNKDKSVP